MSYSVRSAGTARDVFLMSDDAQADGVASAGIGLRLPLILNTEGYMAGHLAGTIIHEIVHKLIEANDYTEEFVLLLTLLTKDKSFSPANKERQKALQGGRQNGGSKNGYNQDRKKKRR